MSPSPVAAPQSHPGRWQFGILGMLLFTASVAVGASVVKVEQIYWANQAALRNTLGSQASQSLDWSSGIVAVILFWMILGLAYQLRDLRSFLCNAPQIDKDRKFGLQLEIFWRAGVIALLLSYVSIKFLFYQGVLSLPENEEIIMILAGGGYEMREAIFVLLLMLIVGSVPYVKRKPKLPWLIWPVNILAGLVAIAICLYRWGDQTFVFYLSHLATIGFDTAAPLKYSLIDPRQYPHDCAFYFYWSILSGAMVIFNGICLYRLAKHWSAGRVRRWFWLMAIFLGIAAVSGFDLWAYDRGFARISPFFAEIGIDQPYHYWVAIGLFFLIAITAVAYRLSVDGSARSEETSLTWRRNTGKYYHEWRTVLVALAGADFGFRLCDIISNYGNTFGASTPPSIITLFAWSYLFAPLGCLWLGLTILALSRACAKRSTVGSPLSEIPRISRAKFTAMWLVTAVYMISGALALVWMSFGLWFNPWFGGR